MHKQLFFAKPALIAALAITLSQTVTAADQSASRIRLMLHPYAAAPGELPDEERAKLNEIAGVDLMLSAKTRTGALELSLPPGQDRDAVSAMLRRLRADRSVLWAEAIETTPDPKRVTEKLVRKSAAAATGQKLMVKLATTVSPDWSALLTRWQQTLGIGLKLDRSIADVAVLQVEAPVALSQLDLWARTLEQDPAVQYADAVRRAARERVPNDPLFSQQWALAATGGGINAPDAWDVSIGQPNLTIAVVDTGIVPHPDLAGRVLPGYDFISDPSAAGDGDARDPNATDTGDSTIAGECGPGAPGETSSWHGTFVAGLIAANADNNLGIAGVNWNAKILPVRVLGKCGGTADDIFAGMMWAAGVPIAGVPVNTTPARIINMSLGGEGPCAQAMQQAIDLALGQGAVVVVAAGNDGQDAANFWPASCSGVITVAAAARSGEHASYSNIGRRVDLAAPGGDIDGITGDLIVSLSNTGKTTAQDATYTFGAGTSAATPYVTGAASLMLSRNPSLTPGRVLGILQGSAKNFPKATSCAITGLCGAGLLDMASAVQSIAPSSAVAPKDASPVVEYYRADLDHYFISIDPAEQAALDKSTIFKRTGFFFYAYRDAASAPADAKPVCRFYASATSLINSHFFSADAAECDYVANHYPGVWQLETTTAFYAQTPAANGACPSGTVPVYRFFDGRRDANHRLTADLTVRREMINRAWAPEGTGPNGVTLCSPL